MRSRSYSHEAGARGRKEERQHLSLEGTEHELPAWMSEDLTKQTVPKVGKPNASQSSLLGRSIRGASQQLIHLCNDTHTHTHTHTKAHWHKRPPHP